MAATLAIAAAGCGSAPAPEAQHDIGSDSWRFELHTTIAPEDLSELWFSGAYDRRRRMGRIVITDHEDASAYTKCEVEDRVFPEEVRDIRGTKYARWLTWGKSFWVKEYWSPWPHPDVVAAVAPFPLGGIDPDEVVERLRSMGVELATVGHDEVRRVKTTHYRGTLEVSKLLEQMPVTEQPRQAVVDFWRDHPHPAEIDAWVDDVQRVRRIRLRLNVEESGYAGEEMTYTLELFGFGTAVDVEEPEHLSTIEDYYRAGEELYPKDDRCESPAYQLRPEEPEDA